MFIDIFDNKNKIFFAEMWLLPDIAWFVLFLEHSDH